MAARIIVLNGIGSVGKTSTARALQKLAVEPFLHVQGDIFLDMIAPQLWGDPEGIVFTQTDMGPEPSLEISMGPAMNRLMSGMRASVAALSNAGNSCIVDDVMLRPADQQAYVSACDETNLRFVGLHAPLNILEGRERARGDRMLGLARWQFDRVHQGISYDFEIDTTDRSPRDCAIAIAKALSITVR